MSITIRKRYDVRCSECGHHAEATTETEAERQADLHRGQHAEWKATAATLVGKVYDTEAPDAKWHGFIDKAVEWAKDGGYEYLAWNGRVYHVESPLDPTVCLARDVPDLTAANRG